MYCYYPTLWQREIRFKGQIITCYTLAMKIHQKFSSWITDYGYMVRGASASILYQTPPDHYLSYVLAHKVPVVIIPGVLGTWSFMKTLADKISLAGHPVYVIPNLGYNLFNIPESAKKLKFLIFKNPDANELALRTLSKKASAIRSTIDAIHGERVILVAHSKGGLIGKYFLAHYNTNNKVIGMISIATPYAGSAMAKLLPLEPISELDTDSQLIKDLTGHTSVNKDIVSIIPEYDNHVWSESGSYLDGADNIEIAVRGHHKIVFDKKVHDVVLESLEKITAKGDV